MLDSSAEVPAFDGFVDLSLYVSFDSGDDVFDVTVMVGGQLKIVDDGDGLSGEAQGESLYLFVVWLAIEAG